MLGKLLSPAKLHGTPANHRDKRTVRWVLCVLWHTGRNTYLDWKVLKTSENRMLRMPTTEFGSFSLSLVIHVVNI
ncbi:hypothetical protein R3I93_020157 [Phoxinus phoxinus]|uniref:Uncharacterized protein n=1 Tax=Phoxinus phoxinus TaxID=58324 RepID=A0AAN9GTB0_9TELE